MEDIRELLMNVYGDTLRKIIEDYDKQLSNEEYIDFKDYDFMRKSILIALEIYTEYNTSSEIMKKLYDKYKTENKTSTIHQ
jgi:hypothetical protein